MGDIEAIKKEYEEIIKKISDSDLLLNSDKIEDLMKKKTQLEKIIAKNEELKELQKKIEEDKIILASGEDPALISLAEAELEMLRGQEKKIQEQLDNSPDDGKKSDVNSIIIEIRAGTGGGEAALFARDLYRMYSRYAQIKGWKQKILDSRITDIGGYKEVTFELSDGEVFSKMQYEGGVHRVQRIPETEKSGRIHTSTATVAILPKPKKTQIKISPADLKIDLYRASGPGGQNVNRRETAVRITHLPSGIVVTSQTERNQLQNKDNAMAILAAKILEKKEESAREKLAGRRRSQIGWAKRAEKIRTYNFPQSRITDHRIKKSWKNLEEIFEGKMERILKSLEAEL